MKIAHIVSTYPPYYGGMGNVVFEIASRLSLRGHTVEVFTPEYKKGTTSESEKNTFAEREDFARRLKAPITYGNAAYMPSLQKELDSFDLVHLHYPFFGSASLVAHWKKRNPHKPLVITYHMDTRGGGFKGLFFKLYTRWVMPRIMAQADLLIASSIDYLESSDAGELYHNAKQKWVEIPFGVDTFRFTPREKPLFLFERYSLDPELPTVVFVGGMDSAHYFKGIPVLLEALLRCKNASCSVQAVLVGDGNLRSEFEFQARGMGLGSLVCFAGKVSYEELPHHYAMGDMSVLPSTTRGEAFGTVILEAFAAGLPVIASDLPGVRTLALQAGDVSTPGNSSELAEGLINFFSEKEKMNMLQQKAREVAVQIYTWDRVIDRLESEYQKLFVKH